MFRNRMIGSISLRTSHVLPSVTGVVTRLLDRMLTSDVGFNMPQIWSVYKDSMLCVGVDSTGGGSNGHLQSDLHEMASSPLSQGALDRHEIPHQICTGLGHEWLWLLCNRGTIV